METSRVPPLGRWVLAAFAALLAAGTASAQPVYKVSNNGPGVEMVEFNGELYYGGATALMRSDGTPAGTTVVMDNIFPTQLTVMNVGGTPRLLFAATGAAGTDLWISDGTGPGTFLLKDLTPDFGDPGPTRLKVVNLQGLGERLLMTASDQGIGLEPWISDGTTAGTVLVSDVMPNTADSEPRGFVELNGQAFFCANYPGPGSGIALIRTDGTAAGTVRMFGSQGETLPSCEWLTVVPGLNTLFFTTNSAGNVDRELWRSNGTDASTVLVKDLDPNGTSDPKTLTAFGNLLMFSGRDGVHGYELWRSDGTEAGTQMVQDIVPGNNFSIGPSQLSSVNGRLYFLIDDTVHGREPWTSDGFSASLLKDIWPGPESSMGLPVGAPADNRPGLVNVQCALDGNQRDPARCVVITHLPALSLDIFWAHDGVAGGELWATDGTTGGTQLLDDINNGPQRSYQGGMVRLVGQNAFLAAVGPNVNPDAVFAHLWALSQVPSLHVSAPPPFPEGNAGTTPANFTAMVFPASGSPITVDFATADGTATTAGGDYLAASGGLTFAPGTTTLTIPVSVLGDTTPETSETFLVNISNGSVPVLTPQATATIVNDDGPGISVNDLPNQIESGLALFSVTLSGSSSDTIMVSYTTANGTAVAGIPPGGDYGGTAGTLTFLPGQTFKSVNVSIISDTKDEANEDFFLNLSDPTYAFLADGQGVCTIIDDDPTPNLTISNPTVAEPSTSGLMSFAVGLQPLLPSGQTITVDYATADGTTNPATAGADYLPISGTLTIPAGSVTAALTLTILGDTIDELNETLFMNLSNPGNVNLPDPQGLGTINDNDTTSITINNRTLAEGNPPGTTPFNFTVTLSAPFHIPLTVDYATAVGTTNPATVGVDYTATSGTLTFAPGTTTQAVIVDVIGDNLDEPAAAETFFVNLSNHSGGNLQDAQGLGSITDDDVASIGIANVSLPEGNAGTTPFAFDMTLSNPSVNQITVHYTTANGTATAGTDYVATSGNLTFAAGETTTTPVTVQVNGDATSEPNETFLVNLSSINGTTDTTAGPGTGTIQNDDTPGFVINDVTVTEGNAGTANATFTVTLLGTFTGSPSVDFATADATATSPADYASASGTLTFTTGVSTRTLAVPVVGETLDEDNEGFLVNLSNPTGGPVVTDGQGTGTINDNDTSNITIGNVTAAENVAGGNLNFTVSFSVPNEADVTLDYATADGTAAAPADYTAVAGTLTFPAGTTTLGVAVPLVDDTLDEPAAAETFIANLSNNSGGNLTDAQATGSITDNDVSSLAVGDISVTEGDAGTVDAVFTVSLGGGKTNDVTVNFATAQGTPNPATADVDYTTTTGTLTFPACTASPCPASSLTQTVTVPVIGDLLPEADENFVLNLSGATGATVSDSQGRCTIVDNDGLPSLSINDVSVVEPATGTLNSLFTVTLAPTSAVNVNVTYATADGTATAGSDYTSATGTLTFTPGSSTRSITVVVRSDAVAEVAETFLVNLTNPVNADFNDDQGVGTIVDPAFSTTELVQGTSLQANLAALNSTTADQDRYRIQQPPRTSWEVLVDGVSGDVVPVVLDRLSSAGAVLQTASPIGDSAVSLRWENAAASPVTDERVRVRSGTGGCGVNCDAQDVYRIQAWDTTYRVARYNNSATQITILVIQNPTDGTVDGTAWFWNASNGVFNGSQTFSIPAKGVFSLNTSTVGGVAGTGGTITVTSDAPYGALLGKAVAVETGTGFTFDTALEPRVR